MSYEKKNIFYNNGHLYDAHIDDKSVITLTVYKVIRPLSKWTVDSKFSVGTDHTNLKIVTVGTFEDPDSGVRKPFIFVYSVLSRAYFLFCVHGNSGKLNSKSELSAISHLQGSIDESWLTESFRVLDGKLLVWQCKKHIYVGSTSDDVTTYKKQTFPLEIDSRFKLSDFSIVSAVADEYEIVILIRCVFKSEQLESQDVIPTEDTGLLVWLMKQDEDGKWVKTELDSSSFLPAEYASTILDCMMTFHHGYCDRQIHSTIVLLLEGGYIVELKDGCLSRCCQIEDNITTQTHLNVCKWKLVNVFDGTTGVIRSFDSDVKVVDLENGKVTQTWSDVSGCAFGDFLQHGRPQLLIIFQSLELDTEISSWLLTDFAGCEIDSRSLPDPDVDSTDKGKKKALDALYNSLQSSTTSLCESEQHLSNKVKFLHNTWQQLHHSIRGREVTLHKPEIPLVSLVNSMTSKKYARSNVKVDTELVSKVIWKRTVGSQLVVGVDVYNKTNKVITQCSLSLVSHSKVSESGVRTSFSKWPPDLSSNQITQDFSYDHSSAKKLKLDSDISLPGNQQKGVSLKPNERMTLTVSTDLTMPGFQNGVSLWVFLTVRESSPAVGGSGDSSLTKVLDESQTVCSGFVSITTQELLQGKFTIFPELTSSQDPEIIEASLSAVQMNIFLEVTSTFTDLTQLLKILQSQSGFQRVPFLHCLCHLTCSPLHFVRVQFPEVISQNVVHLSVWTKDLNQLLLLVQHLYSTVPDDITVSQQTEKKDNISAALSHISKEIKAVSIATRTLLDESSQRVKTDLSSSASISEVKHRDQVAEFQKKFGDQQTAVQKLEMELTDSSKVKVLKDLVRKVQKKTDDSVAAMTSTDS